MSVPLRPSRYGTPSRTIAKPAQWPSMRKRWRWRAGFGETGVEVVVPEGAIVADVLVRVLGEVVLVQLHQVREDIAVLRAGVDDLDVHADTDRRTVNPSCSK